MNRVLSSRTARRADPGPNSPRRSALRVGSRLSLRSAGMTAQILEFAALAVAAHASPALAADSYAGRTIEFVVGADAGGGYDIYARTVARHMPRHIPGNP